MSRNDDSSYISEIRINGRSVATFDGNKRCQECGGRGAARIGICMDCATNAMTGKRMKSDAGRAYAQLLKEKNRGAP